MFKEPSLPCTNRGSQGGPLKRKEKRSISLVVDVLDTSRPAVLAKSMLKVYLVLQADGVPRG